VEYLKSLQLTRREVKERREKGTRFSLVEKGKEFPPLLERDQRPPE